MPTSLLSASIVPVGNCKYMKKYLLIFCLLPLLSLGQQAPFLGAWGLEDASAKITVLLTENIFSLNRYHIADKKFLGSEGGTWHKDGNDLLLNYEWSSTDTSKVGKEFKTSIRISKSELRLGLFTQALKKLDAGSPGALLAFNVKTKEFFGTGGGTYTTSVDGKYVETIEFFTKAASSIGKSVEFTYSFKDGDWRHKGQKSTGGPMDECWTPRKFYIKN